MPHFKDKDHHHQHHHHHHSSPGNRHIQEPNHWLKGRVPVCLSLSLFFGLGILLLFSSPRRQSVHEQSEAIAEDDAMTDEAVAMTLSQWCAFGSLTGYWANAPYPHSHWRIMDPSCTLRDLLVVLAYSAAGLSSLQGNQSDPTGAILPNDGLPPLSLPPRLTEVTKELDRLASMAQQINPASNTADQLPDPATQANITLDIAPEQAAAEAEVEAAEAAAAATAAKSARIMFLSDSVDRYILGYLCDVVGGQSVLLNPDGSIHVEPPPPAAPAPPPTAPPTPTTAAAGSDQSKAQTDAGSQSVSKPTGSAVHETTSITSTTTTIATTTTATTATKTPEAATPKTKPAKPASSTADANATTPTTGGAADAATGSSKAKTAAAGSDSGAGAAGGQVEPMSAAAAVSDGGGSGDGSGSTSQPAPVPPSNARFVRSTQHPKLAISSSSSGLQQGQDTAGGVGGGTRHESGQSVTGSSMTAVGSVGPGSLDSVQSETGGIGGGGAQQHGSGAAGDGGGGESTELHRLSQQGLQVVTEERDDAMDDYDGEVEVLEEGEGQVGDGMTAAGARRALRQQEGQGSTRGVARDGWRPRRRTRVSRSSSTGSMAGAGKRTVRHYLPNMCAAAQLPDLKFMSTYIPGVHPTGPYHRNARKGWRQQIEETAAAWDKSMSAEAAPDIVVVGACLWDLARMWAHEPDLVSGPELSPAVLDSWVANFTRMIMHVRSTLPKAAMIVYHTTMMPRFDPRSGLFDKEHLGRRFYITQLNAAGKQAAELMGLEVLDYAALASRFAEGQVYLADAIHPGPLVGLEVSNILLNYVHQIRQHQATHPDWQHPSMWVDRSTYHDHHRKRQQVQKLQQLQQDRAASSAKAVPATAGVPVVQQ